MLIDPKRNLILQDIEGYPRVSTWNIGEYPWRYLYYHVEVPEEENITVAIPEQAFHLVLAQMIKMLGKNQLKKIISELD